MISPEDFLNYLRRIGKCPRFKPPENIIICYGKRLPEYIIKNHKVKKIEGFFNGDLYVLEETGNSIGVATRFGIGAPAVSTVVEELAANGVKRFLSIGEAGSLQRHLKVGDIILCDRAIRDEGVSHHYIKPSKYTYASKAMVKEIEYVMNKFGLRYEKGTTWTIDAPYMETIDEVKKYQRENVLTVEMEASAIFAIGQFRNVETGAIFTISDYLAELEWKPKFHLTTKHLEMLFQVAKEVLLNRHG